MNAKPQSKDRLIGDNRQRIRQAPIVASVFALILVAVKLSMGIYTGAMVLIASAVDSGLDLLVSLFNYFAIRIAEKPGDDRFNYGRGKLKAIAGALEGMLIALSGLFIIVTAIMELVRGSEVHHTGAAMWVMAASTVMTAILVIYLNGVAKATGDLVVRADALHYKVDLYTNVGILLALGLIAGTGFNQIDPIFSVLIAVYIVREAWGLIHEGIMMLMDRALPAEMVQKIEHILEHTSGDVSGWHLLKTRRSADIIFVDVHLVFDHKISLVAAHAASEEIETRITALADEAWVINCHLDPTDDSRKDRKELPI